MSNLVDGHVHTHFSFDGVMNPIEAVQAAHRAGVGIAITEHFSILSHDVSYGVMRYDEWRASLKQAIDGNSEVYVGLEVGEPHRNRAVLQPILQQWQADGLDVIIGSLHNIGELKLRHYLRGKDAHTAYRDYFAEMLAMVRYGDMDVVGHLDLMRRYAWEEGLGDYIYEDWKDTIDTLLIAIIEKDLALEINTSGLYQGSKQAYPPLAVMRRFAELGGKRITFGSDAHTQAHVGRGLREAVHIAKEAGFSHVCVFRSRQAEMWPL